MQTIVITGTIGAGKTTLARALTTSLGSTYLGSDALRCEIFGSPLGGDPDVVIKTLIHRWRELSAKNVGIVIDTTGISQLFRIELNLTRSTICHLHLICNAQTWQRREILRDDRPSLSLYDYERTACARFRSPPDAIVHTDAISPTEVVDVVTPFFTAEEMDIARMTCAQPAPAART